VVPVEAGLRSFDTADTGSGSPGRGVEAGCGFPVHPRLYRHHLGTLQGKRCIRVVEPVGYSDMLASMQGAALVLTAGRDRCSAPPLLDLESQYRAPWEPGDRWGAAARALGQAASTGTTHLAMDMPVSTSWRYCVYRS